ncbi:MAG: SdpI family protein, partial [Candidatus Aenigmatarchaeota archaeon]
GSFNMIQLLSIAFAPLFYYCGILIENAKRNWFVGIRTPWTLMNETVWNKTHRRGGKLFKLSGVLALVAIGLPQYALVFILVPVILSSIYAMAYSYFEYKKL